MVVFVADLDFDFGLDPSFVVKEAVVVEEEEGVHLELSQGGLTEMFGL